MSSSCQGLEGTRGGGVWLFTLVSFFVILFPRSGADPSAGGRRMDRRQDGDWREGILGRCRCRCRWVGGSGVNPPGLRVSGIQNGNGSSGVHGPGVY
ncbi:uncharacterized protein CLUP02_11377 [Colletotrichum lupini]|uniref:Uncharacterized protein n=1 Tax=Colletotrichum lupini TaxID=145971 RepID=A0A9Q8SZ47_9PEZI|nr:uncharacterized protein CLUP02_11377 [Colletotrichum lupini]UQC85878.1 hypothetical protein CLUP02_11377 [Colletotrichum lupini]